MNTLPIGVYLEDERRFEFDFANHLLKISFFKEDHIASTIVSPFRLVKDDDHLFLLIHNYDRTGDRKMIVEAMDQDRLIIKDNDTSYKLQKVA